MISKYKSFKSSELGDLKLFEWSRNIHLGRYPREKPAEYAEVYKLWQAEEISARQAGTRLGVDHKTFLRWARTMPGEKSTLSTPVIVLK